MNQPQRWLRFYERAERILAPDLAFSQTVYEEVLFRYAAGTGRWLDLGCGRRLLPAWRQGQERALASSAGLLIGMDRDYDSLQTNGTIHDRICGDICRLPFRPGTFDVITSNMVFEHLADPEAQLAEIYRVLRPGGYLIFHTPNAHGYIVLMSRPVPESVKKRLIWFLEQRRSEDVFPTYYRVNTENRIRKVAGKTGFSVHEIRMIPTTCQFARIPPLALVELVWVRLLMTRYGKTLRTNIIGVLRRPPERQNSGRKNIHGT